MDINKVLDLLNYSKKIETGFNVLLNDKSNSKLFNNLPKLKEILENTSKFASDVNSILSEIINDCYKEK